MANLRNLVIIFILIGCSYGVDDNDIKAKILSQPQECEVKAKEGDEVRVHYTSKLRDGTVLKSTFGTEEAAIFVIGKHQVISGLEHGVLQMCIGEKRYLEIPPVHAYGANGKPPVVPPMSEVLIEVELLEIKRVAFNIRRYLNDKRVWFAGYAVGLAIIIITIFCKCLPNLPSQKRKVPKSKKID